MARLAQKARNGKAPSQRQLRVGEEIRHALSEILVRAEFRDPELVGRVITVTEVRASPDLRNATAFVLPLEGEYEPMVEALQRATAYLRGQLARTVKLKYMPALHFIHDESFDEASRIDHLIASPHVAQDLAKEPDQDPEVEPDATPGADNSDPDTA
ncbi:MAG: ribosome-binding factor A [Maricaulis maris]|jgi:ribosome-binding factor A